MRDELLTVRLTRAEFELVRRTAARRGETLSQLVRRLVAAEARRFHFNPADKSEKR